MGVQDLVVREGFCYAEGYAEKGERVWRRAQ